MKPEVYWIRYPVYGVKSLFNIL